jgi:hypothetical protein
VVGIVLGAVLSVVLSVPADVAGRNALNVLMSTDKKGVLNVHVEVFHRAALAPSEATMLEPLKTCCLRRRSNSTGTRRPPSGRRRVEGASVGAKPAEMA